MPYDTRRKSVSLSSLGVHVPKRARQSSNATAPRENGEPPVKRPRGPSNASVSSPPNTMSPPSTKNIRIKTEIPTAPPLGQEHTPPPSPGASGVTKVDTEGIKDDVVVGVIHQLEKTGNRPHTSKELAAVLATCVPTIEGCAPPLQPLSSILSLTPCLDPRTPTPLSKHVSQPTSRGPGP